MGWEPTPVGDIAGGADVSWVPKGGGPAIPVPDGIDPGFGYNPGTAHLRAVAEKATTSIQQALDAGLEGAARQTLREIVDDVAFEQFVALPQGRFPIAVLTEEQRVLIDAPSRLVVIPTQIMKKQTGALEGFVGHAELTIADYRRLPDIISDALVIAQQGNQRLVYFADAQGRIWKAVVRQDAGDPTPVIVSFHASSLRKIDREISSLNVLVDRR